MKLHPNLPVQIEAIKVRGNRRTKLEYFNGEFQRRDFRNLDELQQSVSNSLTRIQNNGSFESANIDIGVREVKKGKFCVDLAVDVKEKGVPFLKMESYVRTGAMGNNVGAEIQAALRSPLGYGESVRFSMGTSYAGSKDKHFVVSIPNVSEKRFTLNVTAKSTEEDNSAFLSFKERVESLVVEAVSRNGKHRAEIELSARDEVPELGLGLSIDEFPSQYVTRLAPKEILATATNSTKSSMKYSFVALDSRDSAVVPTNGSLASGAIEFAAGLGEAQFVKVEAQVQHHELLGPPIFGQKGLSLSLCGSIGLVGPLRPLWQKLLPGLVSNVDHKAYDVHLVDRFHMGGPLSLRGFDNFGVGDTRALTEISSAELRSIRQRKSMMQRAATSFFKKPDHLPPNKTSARDSISLGGLGRASFLAMLSAPVPIESLATAGLRSMLFLTAGSLGRSDFWARLATSSLDETDKVNSFTSPFGDPRISVGAGLVIPLANMARVEVTYSLPILVGALDAVKGFQLGVGINIL